MMTSILRLALAAACVCLAACAQTPPPAPVEAAATAPAAAVTAETSASGDLIPYTGFTLDNGLEVLFHIDRSDPVVAVSLHAHVGSAREKPGRTGFAHLFEHLLFLESENLGKGGLDRLSARVGGAGANGSTNRDRTNYFQTVPKDALEKMIWAEADKLGWFINTVTDPVLAKEKQVVKNEKRQSVDNRPYGHTFSVLHSNLYPEDHPYHWQVIGSLEDLDAATLDDVKSFFRAWYTPNNVVLTITGDFDPAQAEALVRRYFEEIPRGPEIRPIVLPEVALGASKSLFHEDNFASLPELTMAWPAAPRHHPDSYALSVLAELLTDGKSAPLQKILVDEAQITSDVSAFNFESELAGEFILQVRAFDGVDLDSVKAALDEGFARFEAEGVPEDRLERIKIGQEVALYEGLGSVLGKNIQLAVDAMYADDPGRIDADLASLQALKADDVMRVYETYIKNQPFVATSFTPKGQAELALAGAVRAVVVEEEIVQGAERGFDPSLITDYEPTPSLIDRKAEPPYGAAPEISAPAVWEAETPEGLRVFGVADTELPLFQFELTVAGGRLLESDATAGAANLAAEMMTRGTQRLDAAAFEDALADLGAEVDAFATREAVVLRGSGLARNFDAVMALVEEMILTPRFDQAEFDLAKAEALDSLRAARANPNWLAGRIFDAALYGEDSAWAIGALGSETSLAGLDLFDIQAYHGATLTPQNATLHVVGEVSQAAATAFAERLSAAWPARDFDLTPAPAARTPDSPEILFYDVPGAKQSVFYFGRPAMTRMDPAYTPAEIMNYRLGGGGFASDLTQQLRETKGYTYGVGSGLDASARYGEFFIRSGVRSNVTLEAAALVRDIVADFGATYDDTDLNVTKSFFVKSKARSFESQGAKLALLRDIAAFDLPYDYVARETEIAKATTIEDVQAAAALLEPERMVYVVVGDAETQLPRLSELGFGEPVLVNDQVDAMFD